MFTSFDEVPEELKYKKIFPTMFPDPTINIQACIRIHPNDNNTGGFFLALFKKKKAFSEELIFPLS